MARGRATSSWALLEAAAEVFGERGYRNSTIDDIAEAAGVSRPTVYKYTASKQALLDDMVDTVCDVHTTMIRDVLTAEAPPITRLHGLIDLHIENATKMRNLYAIVFSEQTELSTRARARFHEFSSQSAIDLRDLLDECVAQRTPPAPPVDTWIAAQLLLSMLTSLYRWYDPSGQVDPSQLRGQIASLISGVLPVGSQSAL